MIKRFFTTTFTVTRQTWSGDSSSLVSQGTFLGHIQQGIEDNYSEFLHFNITKAYKVWCPADTDVLEGDRLTVGSDSYDVAFIENRNVGSNGHLQLVVQKLEE